VQNRVKSRAGARIAELSKGRAGAKPAVPGFSAELELETTRKYRVAGDGDRAVSTQFRALRIRSTVLCVGEGAIQNLGSGSPHKYGTASDEQRAPSEIVCHGGRRRSLTIHAPARTRPGLLHSYLRGMKPPEVATDVSRGGLDANRAFEGVCGTRFSPRLGRLRGVSSSADLPGWLA
jgi:hypothetical protein